MEDPLDESAAAGPFATKYINMAVAMNNVVFFIKDLLL